MCSAQLSLFSDETPENKDIEKDSKKPDNKVKNQLESTSDKTNGSTRKINIKVSEIRTEEDKKVKEIELSYKAFEELSDEQRIEFNQELKDVALGCTKCVLSKTRNKVVYSAGSITAPIMIIGEGPGENEDLSGIPFVGKAGQLLDRILESGGISRENDVYITNVVKCRPPKNRTPFQDEVEDCSVYLVNQLNLSKAKIILLTGATAMAAILGQSMPITKVRGNWMNIDDKWIMPIFHPSYLLRNPSKDVGSPKWLMWQDIKKVKQKLQELKGS